MNRGLDVGNDAGSGGRGSKGAVGVEKRFKNDSVSVLFAVAACGCSGDRDAVERGGGP